MAEVGQDRSSLHRARGQAGDHELAEDEDQDSDGHHRHHAGGEDGPVRDLEVPAELGDAHRDGPVVVRAVERQRHQELGPAGGEAEDARGEQARQRLRQDDRPDRAQRAGAVDPAGFLHLLRYPEEVVTQDPDGEREVERRVRQDEGLVAVQPAQVAHQQVQRREHGDGGEDRDHQQDHHRGELAAHGQPAERVAGQGAEHEHQRGGRDGDDQRVPEVDAEVVPDERVAVVSPAERGRAERGRAVADRVRRLEAGGDQPVQRQDDEQRGDQRGDGDAVDVPAPAGALAVAHVSCLPVRPEHGTPGGWPGSRAAPAARCWSPRRRRARTRGS